MPQTMNSSRFNLEGKAGWFRSALITGAVVLGVLLPRDGFALDPALDISQYNCQTWGRQNGLPVSGIRSIAQTKDGYLWMGTAIGLIRFEGTEFKVEDLGEMPDVWSSEMVDDLSKAGDGGLWVCLRSSSYGYWNGQTFSFQAREGWSNADPSIHYVRSLLESKEGTLWLGTDNAVLERKGSGDCKEVIGMATSSFVMRIMRAESGSELKQRVFTTGRPERLAKSPTRTWIQKSCGLWLWTGRVRSGSAR
jgi:ligand-binding sensor domain-containing protein